MAIVARDIATLGLLSKSALTIATDGLFSSVVQVGIFRTHAIVTVVRALSNMGLLETEVRTMVERDNVARTVAFIREIQSLNALIQAQSAELNLIRKEDHSVTLEHFPDEIISLRESIVTYDAIRGTRVAQTLQRASTVRATVMLEREEVDFE